MVPFFSFTLCVTLSFITDAYLLFFDTSFFSLIFQLSVIKTSANLFKSAGEDGVVYNFDLRENEPVRKYVLVTVWKITSSHCYCFTICFTIKFYCLSAKISLYCPNFYFNSVLKHRNEYCHKKGKILFKTIKITFLQFYIHNMHIFLLFINNTFIWFENNYFNALKLFI